MDEEVYMARRVFISFRFSDGEKYKTKLCELFDGETKVINCSENEDRSGMSEETIKSVYLIATRDLSNLWLQFFLSQNQGFMRLFEKTVLK